jgi:ABC-type nickel/cobalt efflux system permease component RcnA
MEAQTSFNYNPLTMLNDIIVAKTLAIITLVTSWLVYQASEIAPIISQGFDQLFSIGLLIIAVVIIWKAFTKKDESESEATKQVIARLEQIITAQEKHIETLTKNKDR